MCFRNRQRKNFDQIGNGNDIINTIGKLRGWWVWISVAVLFFVIAYWLETHVSLSVNISSPFNFVLFFLTFSTGIYITIWAVHVFVNAGGRAIPFKSPRKLVDNGPYSYARNPMAFGYALMLFGLGALLQLFFVLFIFVQLFLMLEVIYVKTIEEKILEKKFGREYIAYKEKVPTIFLPNILGKLNNRIKKL